MDNYLDSGQLEGRHPSTVAIARMFLLGAEPGSRQNFSMELNQVVAQVLRELPDSPFLVKGLDHLLSATDCFRRAALHTEHEAFEARVAKMSPETKELLATGGIVTSKVVIGQDVPETIIPLRKLEGFQ